MRSVKVLILGGGPAGISASIWCKRLGLSHLLLEQKDELGGQLLDIYNKVIDYPGLISSDGKQIKADLVNHLDLLGGHYLLRTKLNSFNFVENRVSITREGVTEVLGFEYLIMATGASQRKLGIPGEQQMINRAEVYSTSRDSALLKGKRVAIIGGGDRAFEAAKNLEEHGAFVLLIHRSTQFRARENLQRPVLYNKNIQVCTNSTVEEIYGLDKVSGLLLRNETNKRVKIAVDAVIVRIGIKPNSELLNDVVQMDNQGYITVNKYGKTTVDHLYAIGDVCTSPTYSSIATAIGQGMVAVKNIAASKK